MGAYNCRRLAATELQAAAIGARRRKNQFVVDLTLVITNQKVIEDSIAKLAPHQKNRQVFVKFTIIAGQRH